MTASAAPLARAESSSKPSDDDAIDREIRASYDQIAEWFDPKAMSWAKFDWIVFGWIFAMHVGCLFAPFFFSWQALGVALVLHWLTACIGVTLGFHRLLSHRGFKLRQPARFFVYLCGCLSAEGGPLTWAANHRLHHARSDKYGDPHSPNDGKWWSHILWLFLARSKAQEEVVQKKLVPDLLRDPLIRFFEKTFILWSIALAITLYAVGGWPMLLWGMCVRMTVVYHCTWFVNSVTHLFGYRNYETSDQSRNLWWVALLAYGEGWHNNHHAFPRLARAGHRWWEIDMTFWAIRALQFVGMATDVYDQIPARRSAPPALPTEDAEVALLDESSGIEEEADEREMVGV